MIHVYLSFNQIISGQCLSSFNQIISRQCVGSFKTLILLKYFIILCRTIYQIAIWMQFLLYYSRCVNPTINQSLYCIFPPGNTVSHLGHTIFGQSFLDSRDHCGFLYVRPTFQCVQKLLLPQPPYVFGLLLQKWETPWAKVFPVRLMLRLGAEYRCKFLSPKNDRQCIMLITLCVVLCVILIRCFLWARGCIAMQLRHVAS